MEQGTEDTMSFHEFENFRTYGNPTAEKSVPKQRTAADDWSRLSDDDKASVYRLRRMDPNYCSEPGQLASVVALTYVRRHG